MVLIKDVRKFLEQDPDINYKLKRKYLRDNQDWKPWFPNEKFGKNVNQLVELATQYKTLKLIGSWLESQNIFDFDSSLDLEPLDRIIMKGLRKITVIIQKNNPEKTSDEIELTIAEGIGFLSSVHCDARFKKFKEKVGDLIKKCDSCNQMYVATRADSKYCDKCRNKVHVYKYRKTHKKTFAPKKCEYEGCKKKFVPKTTRARFCSDICRVRNNRFERTEIKERNELCKQIRAEEDRTGIYAITLDEVIHLLEIAPSKKYLQSIKAKK